MINPITAASIGIVLLFIAITYLIHAAPDPPEASGSAERRQYGDKSGVGNSQA